ncbi:MAG: PucR family transcriptional regulator [Methylocystaceae bacterium]
MDQKIIYEAYQKLFTALQKGGLTEISRTAYELLGKPIIIVNAELKKLAQYPDKPLGDSIWDAYYDQQMMSPQMMWQLLDDSTIRRSEKSEVPIWVDWGLVENLPRLVGNVKINGAIEGYVGVLFYEKVFSPADIKITELVCQTVGMELQKKNHLASSHDAIIAAFINSLFQGKITTQDEISRWLKSFNIKLLPRFCVAVAEGDDLGKTTLNYLRNLMENNVENAFVTVLENKLYILFTGIGDDVPLTDFIRLRSKDLASVLTKYNLKLGMSNIFNDLCEMDNYKYQADRTLDIGICCWPENRIYSYMNLMLENLFSYVKESVKPVNYLHPAIETLRFYDKKNGTEYLNTLNIYVTTMCSPSKTTEKLHIHRNTLHYRLNKIEELTGISLGDERICALLLSDFYLLELTL